MSDGCQNFDRGQLGPRKRPQAPDNSNGRKVKITVTVYDCSKTDRRKISDALLTTADKIRGSGTICGFTSGDFGFDVNEVKPLIEP